MNSNKHIAPKVRLGDYITRSTINNCDLKYGIELIEGVTNEGKFAEPKGNPTDVDLKPYKIVNNGAFVYNPSRLDLGSIAYRIDGLCIVSHLYIVFYLNEKGKKKIDPEWLFMYFRRKEFYREVTFRNFGSQRPEFNFNDMSDIMIPLPDITVQQRYVAIYKAMVANQQSYECGLEDLKLALDASLEKYKRNTKRVEEKAFYDILMALRDEYNFEYGKDKIVDGVSVNEKCKALAKKIKEIIDTKSSFADWLNNQIVRDQLKFDIKVCLIKNGYPPQYSPEVFRKVMEQVENFEENNG